MIKVLNLIEINLSKRKIYVFINTMLFCYVENVYMHTSTILVQKTDVLKTRR